MIGKWLQMNKKILNIWVGQGNYAEKRNVTIWSDKCRLLLREPVLMSWKIQYLELQVLGIVSNTTYIYIKIKCLISIRKTTFYVDYNI